MDQIGEEEVVFDPRASINGYENENDEGGQAKGATNFYRIFTRHGGLPSVPKKVFKNDI